MMKEYYIFFVLVNDNETKKLSLYIGKTEDLKICLKLLSGIFYNKINFDMYYDVRYKKVRCDESEIYEKANTMKKLCAIYASNKVIKEFTYDGQTEIHEFYNSDYLLLILNKLSDYLELNKFEKDLILCRYISFVQNKFMQEINIDDIYNLLNVSKKVN